MWLPMPYMLVSSLLGFLATLYIIPHCAPMFLKANIGGIDMGKRDRTQKVPEAGGVISGCIFLMLTFVLIPICFSPFLFTEKSVDFPHAQFVQLIAALLSITCMLLLGFADDVLDLRWRHKLLLPTMASLPLLMVYYVTTDRTDVVLPLILRPIFGTNIGKFKQLYNINWKVSTFSTFWTCFQCFSMLFQKKKSIIFSKGF
jgi:UDP-N-acetylglucosamine--dolichyl-phosphate N-acetylglucosaminephosphotransferase